MHTDDILRDICTDAAAAVIAAGNLDPKSLRTAIRWRAVRAWEDAERVDVVRALGRLMFACERPQVCS